MDESKLFLPKENDEEIVIKSYYKDFFKTIFKKLSFIFPLIILLLIFIMGFLFAHFIDIDKHLILDINKAYIPPSLKYPFGTNGSGQNQFFIIFIASYKTLLLALIATFINVFLGIILGILWGTSKKFDSIMFIIKNFVDNTPLIFFFVIIIMILGNGFFPLLLGIVLFGWIEFAFIIRNNILLIKSKDYNKVSKLYNVSSFKIALNNYLPSILPILFNSVAFCIPKMISLEIIISYFGFSFGNNIPTLGTLIYSSIYYSTYISDSFMFFIPFAFLFIINLCTYLINKTISNNFNKGGI